MTQPPFDPNNPAPPPGYGQQPPPPGYPTAPAAEPAAPPPGYGQQPPQGGYAAAPPPSAGYGYGVQPAGPGMHFDPASGLTLPDGVELASIGRRIGSYFMGLLLAIVTLGIGFIIWGLIVWGRGQTPAQQVLKMRCWREESRTNAGWGWMALREVVGGIVEGLLGVITGLISLILMVSGSKRKCIKDYIAGTVVLHDPNGVLAPRS